MSHKNKASLRQQVAQSLQPKFRPGVSKHQDKQDGVDTTNKIYSYGTLRTYNQHCIQFVDWCKSEFRCKTLEQCREHVMDYLKQYDNAYTWDTKLSAIAKLYGCKTTDIAPSKTRHRADITRTRWTPGHLFEERHADLVRFCRLTGLRRHELQALRGDDVELHEGRWCIHVRQGKGGKERWSMISGDDSDIEWILNRMKPKVGERVFPEKIGDDFPVHYYRAQYADAIYQRFAHDLDWCKANAFYDPQKDNGKGNPTGGWCQDSVYWFRAEKAGQWLDKSALMIVSRQLGHNRISVAAAHYIGNTKNTADK